MVHCDHVAGGRSVCIHVIDASGYPECVGRALGALDVVETVAVVVSASAGIELMTRRMMKAARACNLCSLIVVNKIDQENLAPPAPKPSAGATPSAA